MVGRWPSECVNAHPQRSRRPKTIQNFYEVRTRPQKRLDAAVCTLPRYAGQGRFTVSTPITLPAVVQALQGTLVVDCSISHRCASNTAQPANVCEWCVSHPDGVQPSSEKQQGSAYPVHTFVPCQNQGILLLYIKQTLRLLAVLSTPYLPT